MVKYLYTFVPGSITDAFVVVDPVNAKIVYASLGKNKPTLLKTAKDEFMKLHKSHKETEYELDALTKENSSTKIDDVIEEYSKVLNCQTHYYDERVPYEVIFGTPFQRKVWTQLHKLTAGETISYGQLARDVGSPNGQRAIARACAANKIALLIPCHCVLNNQGRFQGYRWGVDVKKQFLQNL